MDNFDYLVEESEARSSEPTDENSISYLLNIAEERTKLLEEKEELEDKLKRVNERITHLEQKVLPTAMYEKGMSSLELTNGYKLRLKENISCSVKDMHKLVEFLDARGDGSLINTTVTLGKIPQEISAMIANDLKSKYAIDAMPEYKIHPQTLKAYFTRLCGVNNAGNATVALAEIDPEMVSIHSYYKVETTKK